MALEYKLEFIFDESTPSDSSVFIHLRENPPIYQSHIDKEDYDILEDDDKHEFLTALFTIAGVVELSTTAYRIWLMKSPVYYWSEVMNPILAYLKDYYGEDSLSQLPGSAQVDGQGFTLTKTSQRRKI